MPEEIVMESEMEQAIKDMKEDIVKSKTEGHENLVRLGRRILEGLGFPNKNIEEECRVYLDNKNKYYIVDIYATKGYFKDIKIAVECGKVDAEKVRDLQENGILVLCLPFSFLDSFDMKLIHKELVSAFDIMFRSIKFMHQENLGTKKELQEKLDEINLIKNNFAKKYEDIYRNKMEVLDRVFSRLRELGEDLDVLYKTERKSQS